MFDRCQSQLYSVVRNSASPKNDPSNRRHSSSSRKLANLIADSNRDPAPKEPKYITSAALSELISDPLKSEYDNIVILDCRYPHEYKGGRILGAVNVRTHDQLCSLRSRTSNALFVFYSEDSSSRAPAVHAAFRRRAMRRCTQNGTGCHCAILKDGFKKFYADSPHLCVGSFKSKSSAPLKRVVEYERAFQRDLLKQGVGPRQNKKIRFGLNRNNSE